MSLRDTLLSAGLKPRDLREAVKHARETAHTAVMLAKYAEVFLNVVQTKATGEKTRKVVGMAGIAVRKVREVAEETLRKR